MREFARVLRPGGRLLVGFVPADTPWGRDYARKSQDGHPFYAAARFYTVDQTRALAEAAGLRFLRGASTLPDGPEARVPGT